MEIPLKQIKNLLKTLEDGGASEFEYEDDKVRVRVSMARGAPVVTHIGAPMLAEVPVASGGSATKAVSAAGESADPNAVFVTSPFVGTFYRAPAPDADPFVDVGSAVKKGQTLCIVEAMKLMNEIEAEFAGTIIEVLADNGTSVEFGQKLFKLRKA
jgi:acetyl-CoA carboxylase biotin carboxyl carrier protein